MKKVGLITFHHLPNFGACLQAWALVDVLRRLDCDVSVIDYRSIRHEIKFKRKGVRALFPSWGRFRLRRFVKSHMPLTDAYRSREQVERHVASSNYDALICGSDQVWMVDNHLGFDRTYFLDVCGTDGPRRISYAPSCGNIESFGKDTPKIRELLLLFHSISARDRATIRILATLGIDHVVNVIDPTLLADFGPLVRRPIVEQPYIAVAGPLNAAGE